MRKILTILIILILILWSVKTQPKTLAYNQSPYGINIGNSGPFWAPTANEYVDPIHYPRIAFLLKEVGVKWVRVSAPWRYIERKDDDQWDEQWLARMKSFFEALHNEGINISLVFGGTPGWACINPSAEDPKKYPPAPEKLGEWEEFVQELANRFGEELVQAWEIENEVSGKEGFIKQENRWIYVEMVKRAAKIIRDKDKNDVVVLSSFVPFDPYRGAIIYWLKNAGPYVDILNVHKYTSDDVVGAAIERFKGYANEAGVGDKPIWLTETNICCPNCGDECRDPNNGGERLVRRYKLAFDLGMKKVFWFNATHNIGRLLWGPGILLKPRYTQSGQFEPYDEHPSHLYSSYRKMATGKKTIPLSSGWNQITWPDVPNYTAKTALEDIDNDCTQGTAVAISRKTKDWWEDYVKNYGGKNFALNAGKSYHINVVEECHWRL